MFRKLTRLTVALVAAIVLALSISCDRQEINYFDAAPSLFFYRGTGNSVGLSQIDSTSYSFFLASTANEDTVWVDVRLTGMPSGTDHPLPVVQHDSVFPGSAVAGTHFVALDDPRVLPAMILPAGATGHAFPVIVKRVPEMDTTSFRLVLEIIPDNYFVAGIKERTRYTINITAMAVKPAAWDRYYDAAFGTWGQEKMRFLIEHVKYTAFDESLANTDIRVFLNLKAREKLAEYEAANGPLYEADNITRVTFP